MALLHILTAHNGRKFEVADNTADFIELIRLNSSSALHFTLKYDVVDTTEDNKDSIIRIIEDIKELQIEYRNPDGGDLVKSVIYKQIEVLEQTLQSSVQVLLNERGV